MPKNLVRQIFLQPCLLPASDSWGPISVVVHMEPRTSWVHSPGAGVGPIGLVVWVVVGSVGAGVGPVVLVVTGAAVVLLSSESLHPWNLILNVFFLKKFREKICCVYKIIQNLKIINTIFNVFDFVSDKMNVQNDNAIDMLIEIKKHAKKVRESEKGAGESRPCGSTIEHGCYLKFTCLFVLILINNFSAG